MDDSIDGQSTSNKEFILRNWKALKEIIEPEYVLKKFFPQSPQSPQSSIDDLRNKSHSHQATLVLIKVHRQVQSSEKEYQKFVEILRSYSSTADDALSKCVGGPINKPETVNKHLIEQARESLKRFKRKIKEKLKRNPEVVIEITDNFIECGLLDIDTVENILHSLKEAAEHLVSFVITNIHLGTYNRLLATLKSGDKFNGLVSDLTTDENIKTATNATVQENKRVFSNVTTETAGGHSLSIRTKPDNPKMYKALLDPDSPADVSVFKHLGSMIEKKKENSAILTFAPEGSENDSAFKDKIQQGALTLVMDDIIKYVDDSVLKELSELDVKVRCLNNNKRNMSTTMQPLAALQNIAQSQSVQQTTESVQYTMNVTIIAANRSSLIEEINTMALVSAFQNEGITCFDGLDGTMGRQQRAEGFLTILEKNNLLDQLLVILREQGMTYVLDRLNNCRNTYLADPQQLRRNIFNNRTQILHDLDIDDVREIFVEREVFSSSMFDEIEKKYSQSEDQMSAVLIKIINSGPPAMRILVDVLYIHQLDSLADNLLRKTPNEMQEMEDNTQTDESSPEGELLFEATYVVSKADE